MNPTKKASYWSALTGLLLVVATSLFAQTTSPPAAASTATQVYTFVEQMPRYNGGGNDSIIAYLRRSTRYPAEAIQAGASGKVFVTFVVNAQGQVEQARVVRPVHPALDQEALRVVTAMSVWQPGQQQGKPVAVAMTVPISFAIQQPTPDPTAIVDAKYPGGPEALLAYLQSIPYPEAARPVGLDARVFIQFKIDKEGKVIEAKPIGPLMRKPQQIPSPRAEIDAAKLALEKAATQWIQAMPTWTPATLKEVPVESDMFVMPLIFNPVPSTASKEKIYPYADQMPTFNTQPDKYDLQASIRRSGLKYPAQALRNRQEGTVYLYVVINETGAFEQVQVVRSAGAELNQAVLEAVRNQPAAVTPAQLKGKPVKVFYVLPFTFNIR
ncbi:energy transducer TonB [Hymenobacter volaticus]|uniref:TonB family protein n=1 Tax=Hymenobacter volaticus TaxID=2932254 RepID=A0ABY4G4U7_9BACT|nr:energy transducer TonB [Hymenobacter volaticus]UOQ65786.1 TonB family protein [Hymenobacter volaticus]